MVESSMKLSVVFQLRDFFLHHTGGFPKLPEVLISDGAKQLHALNTWA